jgi:electron-transferring-flavoprotein dehydrogenase
MQQETIRCDIVVVGAGPAGLATAIRLKQQCIQNKVELSILVLEKGSQVGAHIISGCVMDPKSMNELIPNWQMQNSPDITEVTQDKLIFLTKNHGFTLPLPKAWGNLGNYVISLSKLCVWLSQHAENLGIDIYSGFAAMHPIIEAQRVVGVTTADIGYDRNNNKTLNYQPGVRIEAKQIILAEGCRGSLTKQIIKKFQLDTASLSTPTFGLGIKEVWQVDSRVHSPGFVSHYMGYPLNNNAYGGGFMYHLKNNLVAVGLVTALDYKNPYLNPYEEFQKFKQHPYIYKVLTQGKLLEYGARAITEGGVQAIPKLTFPGGVLVGDAAGFVDVPKVKGVHNAIKSGILAAEAVFAAIQKDEKEAVSYQNKFYSSWLYKDLYKIRNIRPAFKFGIYIGILYSGLEYYLLRGFVLWTFKSKIADHQQLQHKSKFKPILYAKPDGVVTFTREFSLSFSNIVHEENQPCHLKLKNLETPISINWANYASPEINYCPANVYQLVSIANNSFQLQIASQNCLHCKACDIKDPTQNITWVPPESGSGPQYSEM